MDTMQKETLLVIAPHPDDETIGCAGLLRKVKEKGGKTYVLFLTVGDTVDFSKLGKSTGSTRKKEIQDVIQLLSVDDYDIAFEGNEYHLRLDELPQFVLMNMIEKKSAVAIEKVKPTIVAFPSLHSYNQDHRAAALATHATLRPADPKLKHFVKTVLSYESPADMWGFDYMNPNFFISLTENELKKKIDALSLYPSQTREHPNLRSFESLRSLATLRGAACGAPFAEAFFAHRNVLNI